ncbi:MAG: GDP-mannose 4,6-dehydratase [Planctomycetaceae bacterium]|nr:GDP-mannose 4,6-dehydratase [Planctomycetaceae bacterium]
MIIPRKLLVLGANSFSGQDFVDYALDQMPGEILGVSRSPERSALFLRYRSRSDLQRYRYFSLDMNRDAAALLALCDEERPDAIVNFAAQSEVAPSWDHPQHWFTTNTVALAEFINHLRRQDYLRRYLHISSPEVYGSCVGTVTEDAALNPSTPYAASKAAADLLLGCYAQQFGFPLLTVRATNVFGARQQLFKIIPRSFLYLRLGRTIQLHGGGSAVKSYIHVRDVSRGEWAILTSGQVGRIYHLSPDHGIAVCEVVKRICAVVGADFEQSVVTVGERLGQDAAYVIDSTEARTALNWIPQISFDEGLQEVGLWVRNNWGELKSRPLDYIHRA